MKNMKRLNKDISYKILFDTEDDKEFTFESFEDNILTVVAEDGATYKHYIKTEEV